MKRVILPIGAAAAFALSASSFAVDASTTASTSSTAALSAQVNALSAQTKKLQKEVAVLKKKQAKLKQQKADKKPTTKATTANVPAGESPEIVHMWRHYVTVTTVPFTARHHLSFSGADLLYNVSSMNEDLTLLQQKAQVETVMEKEGYTLNRPILQVSGSLQGQVYSSQAFTGNSANGGATSGIALSAAELDFNALASSWATAFMALDYSGSPVSTGNRNPNSEIYLERGFVTLGNLNKLPIYFTTGLMYVPFGAYTTSMVSTPETQSMMEIRTPTALLGFAKGDFSGSLYAYQGSQTSGGDNVLEQGGVNAMYKHAFGEGGSNNFNVGAGWTSNVADSQGMQGTGYSTVNNQFSGFGTVTNGVSNNNLVHAVGGVDAHTQLIVGPVSLFGEYMTAAERFSPLDLQYDGQGALPSAEHAEVDYTLPFFPKKYSTALGVSYDHTAQALALNLEQNKYAVFLNTSLLRETIESIEYNYQTDYSTGSTSTGRGAAVGSPIVGTGRGINTVLAQVGVYF